MSVSMVIGREQCLPWNLPFGAPTHKDKPTTDYIVNLMKRLCHPTLCPSTFEGGQWHNEGTLWPPNQLCQIPGKTPDLGALPNPDWRVVSKAATTLGRPLQGCHLDQSCSLQDSVPSQATVVQLNRLATYLGATWDKQPWGGSNVSLNEGR
jgi:hypothetical protein